MRLFHAWLSSASRRVRLCLAEKNIPYESHAVDLSKQEQHAPEFLAMNPDGVVPALEITPGRFLHESSTICEYLDDFAPEPPLRPMDAYVLAQMRNFVRWTDEKSLPPLLILNWSLMLQSTAQQWSDQELQDKLARIPTAERREAWVRIARKPYSEEEKADALRKLLLLVDKMEGMLASHSTSPASSSWLMGADYSLADIAAAPFIARIAEIDPGTLAESVHPNVCQWWRAIQRRPAFAAARLQLFGEVLQERQSGTNATA
jgi:glutathione S-transferase